MIAAAELDAILQQVEQQGLSELMVSQLRGRFPGMHFTYCMDDDINSEKPVATGQGFALYLVDSREHCSCLTTDLEVASGIVLAEVIPD